MLPSYYFLKTYKAIKTIITKKAIHTLTDLVKYKSTIVIKTINKTCLK